ncbi:hypothetical protein EC973_009364 [Apophysomyces ossiformis]|uniref:Uncharacterized protein n=1 Tax=Apophysomyces ossiformis TaxID=679940 RepID=A0A8H7BZ08_9FUNG|nr:hypothetical protein EC973_009364 [Apophysomyces ossiformis]
MSDSRLPGKLVIPSQAIARKPSVSQEQNIDEPDATAISEIRPCITCTDPTIQQNTTITWDGIRDNDQSLHNVLIEIDAQDLETIDSPKSRHSQIEEETKLSGKDLLEDPEGNRAYSISLSAIENDEQSPPEHHESAIESPEADESGDEFGAFGDFSDLENNECNGLKKSYAEVINVRYVTGQRDTNEVANEKMPMIYDIERTIAAWRVALSKTFGEPARLDSYTEDYVTTIQRLVLQEATEFTWAAVMHSMGDDTGVPKVKWHNSETEKIYLAALHCQRDESNRAFTPSILHIDSIAHKDEELHIISTQSPQPIQKLDTPVSPSSKSSSRFSFSFSKLLPHISTSILPRSPTSAPRSPFNIRSSIDAIDTSESASPKNFAIPTFSMNIPSYNNESNEHLQLSTHNRTQSDMSHSDKEANELSHGTSLAQTLLPAKERFQCANKEFPALDGKTEAHTTALIDTNLETIVSNSVDTISGGMFNQEDADVVLYDTRVFHGSLTPLIPSPQQPETVSSPTPHHTDHRRHTTPAQIISFWEDTLLCEATSKDTAHGGSLKERAASCDFDTPKPTMLHAVSSASKNFADNEEELEFGDFAGASDSNPPDDFGKLPITGTNTGAMNGPPNTVSANDSEDDWGEWAGPGEDLMQ